MEFKINLRLKTIPEIEAVESKISTVRIYNATTWNNIEFEELNQRNNRLFVRTTMGAYGSTDCCLTGYFDYYGKLLYARPRFMPYDY